MRVSEATLCLLGQSNKAIGDESPIGPCGASHPVDNRQACCFRNDGRRHDSEMKPTGERKRISASHAETKQRARPEEDRSQSRRTRSRSGAECPDKNGWVLSRWGGFSLDIPFYRTCPSRRLFVQVESHPLEISKHYGVCQD